MNALTRKASPYRWTPTLLDWLFLVAVISLPMVLSWAILEWSMAQ